MTLTDPVTTVRQPSPGPVEPVTVRPLSGHTGAELGGVDLAAPLTAATVAAINDALHRWKVVFFALNHAARPSSYAFSLSSTS